jgi:hypothetical protein
LEPIVNVDWVFVRKCAATESVATLESLFVSVDSPKGGELFSTTSVLLNVTVNGAITEAIWYELDGGAATLLPTNTSITVADGAHSITFYANDTLGNTNAVIRTFTVDTAAPVVSITSPSDNANLTSGTVNVAFTATDLTKDDTWYTVDGGAPTIVTGSSFSVPLADGAHTIAVFCNDSVNWIGSDSVSITIDTAYPEITVNSPANGAILWSSNVSLNVYVVDNDLSTIWYELDGGAATLLPTNTSITVADGAHSITFYANDTLGNTNAVIRTFTVDTAAPVVSITSPSDNANLTSGTVNVAFTATDLTKDDTWYTVDGGAPVIVTGSSFSVPLADGAHTIIVNCNDSLGQIGSDSVSITIDMTPPVITVNSPANGAMLGSSSVSLNVLVVDPHISAIWYRLDGGAVTMLPTNTSITVADGLHSITFYANDTFGHVNSVPRTFTVDTAAPVVSITSPSDGANLSNGTVNIAFTATDLTKDDTWYTVDGGAPTIVTGSSFSVPLADGAHTIVVYCNDSLSRNASDTVAFTIDTTDPFIAVSGFAGLNIQQGDVEYLTWTLFELHPSTYTLRLNGQVVRSGMYSSGGQVSVQIDSSTVGQLNYTMIVLDTFGNVQRHERLISVISRTDGGIFLSVGVNYIVRNGTHVIALTLDMSHWAVLYLDVAVSVTTTSNLLPGPLPSGLVIALPVAFNMNITNSSALSSGSIRIFYSQASIANQVDENTMVPLWWNEATSSWLVSTTSMSRTANFIDITLSVNGLYIIAAKPKQNYDPILIIVLIGISGGIVAMAGYGYARKKTLKQKVSGKGKSTTTYSSGISSGSAEQPIEESLAKRARLMRMGAPSSASSNPARVPATSSNADMMATLMPAKKKAGATEEPNIDFAARAESAQKMASEVSVESIVPRCVVHKGPISGLSYTCKHCGVQYCLNCATHLAQSGEKCWNCGGVIDVEGLVPAIAEATPTRPMEGQVTMFEPEVFAKISELGIEEGLVDDLLELLKDIPVNNRLQYIEDMFKETPEDEEDSL